MSLDPKKPYHSVAPGPAMVSIPTVQFGSVEALHADESHYFSHSCRSGRSWVGFALALRDPRGKDHLALYISLTPDEARDHAANLLRIADKIDGGRGKQ